MKIVHVISVMLLASFVTTVPFVALASTTSNAKHTAQKHIIHKKVVIKKKSAPKSHHKVVINKKKHHPFVTTNAPLIDPNNAPSSPAPIGR